MGGVLIVKGLLAAALSLVAAPSSNGSSRAFLRSMKRRLTEFSGIALLFLSICVAPGAHARTSGDSSARSWANSPYMLGDWGGKRTALERSGIVFNFVSVNDFLEDTLSDVANWSRVRDTLDIDFGKADLVEGLSFHITALWRTGGNMGTDIRSIANPSSLVGAGTTRLDSWWFQRALANNKVFIRVGQFAGLDFYGNRLYGCSQILEPLGCAVGDLNTAARSACEVLQEERIDNPEENVAGIRTFPNIRNAAVPVAGPLIGAGLAGWFVRLAHI